MAFEHSAAAPRVLEMVFDAAAPAAPSRASSCYQRFDQATPNRRGAPSCVKPRAV